MNLNKICLSVCYICTHFLTVFIAEVFVYSPNSAFAASATKASTHTKKVKARTQTAQSSKQHIIEVEEDKTPLTCPFKGMPLDIEVKAKEVYLIDFQTNTVLLEKNATRPMHPASMTKIMTAYLVVDKIKKGVIKPDQLFIVNKNGYKVEGSSMFLEVDKPVSVLDLLKGLIIQSGNDASVTLAENISGTTAAFAAEMTRKAEELGATQTIFKNASGLPDEGHLTTAKDLAIISKRMIEEQGDYYPLYKEKSFTYNKITQGNRNPLLYKKISCDGIKTGHTTAAGYGMVASCTEGDRRLILVVNGLKSMQARSDEALKLMTFGLRSFATKTLLKPNEVMGPVVVQHGKVDKVMGYIPEGLIITVPKIFENDIKANIVLESSLKAPIQQGDVIGSIELKAPFWSEPMKVNILAKSNVEKANFISCLLEDLIGAMKKK